MLNIYINKYISLRIVFVCVCSCLFFYGQAQIPEHIKYTKLRKRLKENFLKVGPQPGESIPASRIFKKWDNATNRYYTNVEFGDATIHVGWYLAMLATENYLLRKEGRPTQENEEELYYALYALERLDKVSNVAWSYGQNLVKENATYDTTNHCWIPKYSVSTEPDGFFIRDDTPPYFYKKLNGAEMLSSDFTDHNNPTEFKTDNLGGEESKDQIISILFGLFFVHRFVHDDANYQSINLKKYNKTITKRIVDFIRYERLNQIGSWKISNPGKGYQTPRMGFDPILFSYPMATIANEIVYEKKFSRNTVVQSVRERIKPNYQSSSSIFTKQIFLQLRESKVILDKNDDWHINYYMIFMLASVSNVWSYNMAYDKNCAEILRQRCSDEESKGWLIYPLINYALYPDGEIPYPKEFVEKELEIYPENGSYNYFNTKGDSLGKYTPHWFSSNRFQSSNGHYEGKKETDCNSYFNGSFNGLDYMTLYNLYRIIYSDSN